MADHTDPEPVRSWVDVEGSAPGDQVVALMDSWDWSATPVGDPASWSPTLHAMVRVVLGSRFAMWMGWGPELAFFYNDAYRRDTLGGKHPWALGRPAREVWAEIWDEIGPRVQTVLDAGVATWDEDLRLLLERSGFPEETFHTFSYSPVVEADGTVVGLLCVVSEETDRVVGDRRLTAMRDLGAVLGPLQDTGSVYAETGRWLQTTRADLPFALLYTVEGDAARLVAAAGVDPGHPAAPARVGLDATAPWPIAQARVGRPADVVDLTRRLGAPIPVADGDGTCERAVVVPLAQQGEVQPAAFLVAGVSPSRPFDAGYRGFVDLVGGQIEAAIARSRAFEAERRRAEAIAEIDRAKTEFFSNVSHELRTPLTLIAGPASDSLADVREPLPPTQRERVLMIERNARRLRRLVNDLLDFARIEAGRLEPDRRPVDLAGITRDIVTSFAPAVDRAGVDLVVDCPPLGHPVPVDVEMWEKVVLNLLSNALKFTLAGTIDVRLRGDGAQATLEVADTGIGIPADELPALFDRFHRVSANRGRSHEGTGLGLALVSELVGAHGGTVEVTSVQGEGSTFTVTLPAGPVPGATGGEPSPGEPVRHDLAGVHVDEAAGWRSDEPDERADPSPFDPSATVLVVDDNADLRDYLARTLAPFWRVRTAHDGKAALEVVAEQVPDLVLSDVMMPEMDGFELLRSLRSSETTATIPVILLSARAGEEASADGLGAGADDYLVKPFSTVDLLARVRSNLELARFRNEESDRRRALVASLDEAVIIADPTGTVIEANPAFQRMLGYDHLATPFPVPHPWWPTAEEDPIGRAVVDVAAAKALAGEHGRATVPLWHADGRRVFCDASFSPLVERRVTNIVVSLRDVTAEVVASDRQAAVARLSAGLARATDVQEVCAVGLDELQSLFGARAAAVLLGDLDDPDVIAAPPGLAPEAGWRAAIGDALVPGGDAPVQLRRALAESIVGEQSSSAFWVGLDPPRVVGDDELALFRLVCRHLELALHRARLYDQQVEVATAMQRSILGPTVTVPGVAARYVPAVRPLEVGGDWYDVIELPGDRFGVIVGDCVGKGLEAATVMGQLRSAARALFLQAPDPAGVLGALDAFARQIPGAECATVVCGLVDRRAGTVTYSSAGHVPGVVVYADGGSALLDGARSTPLASLGHRWTNAEAPLPPGSSLLLWTDGLVERRGEDLAVSIDRLADVLSAAGGSTPGEVADHLLAELVDGVQRDDVALVLFRRDPVRPFDRSVPARTDQLRPMRLALRDWLAGTGLDRLACEDVLLAVSEALANAVEHAHPAGRHGSVRVASAVVGDRLVIDIEDDGVWRQAAPSDQTRGRGITIMEAVMDEVSIRQGARGTHVHLVRSLRSAPGV